MDWSRHSILVDDRRDPIRLPNGTPGMTELSSCQGRTAAVCHLLILLISCLISAREIMAYPTPVDFTGKLERWPIQRDVPKVTWEVQSDDEMSTSGYKELVRESATIWSDVHGSYVELEAAAANTTAMITIHFDSTIVGGDSSAGYAEFDSTNEHGPVHCSIHIAAPSNVDWAGLAKTTLHEMGHCLGLGHSVVPESIMSYRLDKNDFALALDDEAAVSRLYPVDGSSPRKPAGCMLGQAQSGSFKLLCFLLLLLPITVTLKRRLFG